MKVRKLNAFFSWQQAIRDSAIEPTTKLVCYTIGTHVAADGSGAYPSYATIAKESGLNRSTVIKHVKLAAAAGLLRTEERFDDEGEQTSNLYVPLMPVVYQEDYPSRAGRPPLVAQDHPNNPSLTIQGSMPPESPKSTKAPRRATNTGIRLDEFLSNSGGLPPAACGDWASNELGWDAGRVQREWIDFHDYWTSGNAVGGGRKADWFATWRSHCRRASNRGGGGSSRGSTDRGLAGAMRSSLAQRHGATQPHGGVSGGTSPIVTSVDGGGAVTVIPPGEIPF